MTRASQVFQALALCASAYGLAGACGGDVTGGAADDEAGSGGRDSGGEPGAAASGGAPAAGAPGLSGCDSLVELEGCSHTLTAVNTARTNVLLVLDRSASMANVPVVYPGSKWDVMTDALIVALDEVKAVLSLGLQVFPAAADPNASIPDDCAEGTSACCQMPADSEMNVPIGPGAQTYDVIVDAITDARPAGGSPAAAALRRAHAYFDSGAGRGLGGDRIVLLLTDGGPNCNPGAACVLDACTLNIDGAEGCAYPETAGATSCCGANPLACLDDFSTIAAIEDLAQIGVPTIVVGIPGPEAYMETLLSSAQASGFTMPSGDYGYVEVPISGSIERLTETLASVRSDLVSECRLPIEAPVLEPTLFNVAVDCSIVPYGESPGAASAWHFEDSADPTVIVFTGGVCDRFQRGDFQRIDLAVGCPRMAAQ